MADEYDQLDFGDPTTRATDPQTSHDAAHRMKPLSGADRIAVLRVFSAHYLTGLTDYELADRMDRQQNSVGKRRGELRDHGLIEALILIDGKPHKRPAPSGSPIMVWIITEAGKRAAASLSRGETVLVPDTKPKGTTDEVRTEPYLDFDSGHHGR